MRADRPDPLDPLLGLDVAPARPRPAPNPERLQSLARLLLRLARLELAGRKEVKDKPKLDG